MTRVHDLRTPAWRVEADALEHNLRSMADCGLESFGMDHGDPTIDGAKLWFCSDEHLTFAAERRVRVGDRIRVRPAHALRLSCGAPACSGEGDCAVCFSSPWSPCSPPAFSGVCTTTSPGA